MALKCAIFFWIAVFKGEVSEVEWMVEEFLGDSGGEEWGESALYLRMLLITFPTGSRVGESG